MRLTAPAKINWTLEVLARRDDGYHEVRTVLQTIDLWDEVRLEPADTLSLTAQGDHQSTEQDLALAAARLLAEETGRPPRASIGLAKRIPSAAGLGGGSSDAAAALRGLDRLWGTALGDDGLSALAARLGSDVPFFLRGGTALAEGRGELVSALPDVPTAWLLILVPPYKLADKTKRMYQALTTSVFSDGSRSQAVAQRIREGERIDDPWLFNAFEPSAFRTFAGLERYREVLLAAGARRVHLTGSGPALFALASERAEAEQMRRFLPPSDGEVFLARTIVAPEALTIRD
jgi:4-diphosphocytidyl-2-C-methyl-D-erythritol kinase